MATDQAWIRAIVLGAAIAICHSSSTQGDEVQALADRVAAAGGGTTRDSGLPGVPIVQVSFGPKPLPKELIAELANLEELRRVNWSYQAVTDDDLKALAPFEFIDTLDLIGTHVTGTGFRHLKHLKRLDNVLLHNANVTDAGLKEIAQLPALRSLAVADNKVTDKGLEELVACKTLKDLNLQRSHVTDAGLKILLPLTPMRMDLPEQVKTDLGMKHYQEVSGNLIELSVGSWNVGDAGLAAIDTRKLRWADLSHTKITDAGLKALAHSSDLQELNLSGCAIDGTGLASLAAIPYLRRLELVGCPLSDEGIDALAKLQSVTTLALTGKGINAASLAKLATLENLESLRLSTVPVDDDSIEALSKFTRLKSFQGPILSRKARATLRAALPNCRFH